MTTKAMGVDNSRFFDVEIDLGNTLIQEMMATAPAHMGDIIDQRPHADHTGDTGYAYIFGGQQAFRERTGNMVTYDKLSAWRSSYTIKDYYGGVSESRLRMSRERSGMIEPWIRSWGQEFKPAREQDLIRCLLHGKNLLGATVTHVGHDNVELISASHVHDYGTTAFCDPAVVGATYSNKLELPAAYPTASGWTKDAAEAAYELVLTTAANWVNNANRPFNIVEMSDVQILIDSKDTSSKKPRNAFRAAFDSTYKVSDAADQPLKNAATLRFTPWLRLSDRVYFIFAAKGLDNKVASTGNGPFGLAVHKEPESIEFETHQGDVELYVPCAWGYFAGQWWRICEVRLNGAASSSVA